MKNYVGLDLGTSSVKAIQRFTDGRTKKESARYTVSLPEGWIKAATEVLSRFDLGETAGIGLASQVGTFVVDGRHVIEWNNSAGEVEIRAVLTFCEGEEWDREISMRHPPLISYPLPRLMYIHQHYPDAGKVCQPKELLLEALTGEQVTDPWSWRGLCKPETRRYSKMLLDRTGMDESMLPPVRRPEEVAGRTRENGRIPAGIPVYTGLNDFYASLLGLGMQEGELFDITGTSEHLGTIEREYRPDGEMVSGPWLKGYAHYGVTASSGKSLAFGEKLDRGVAACESREAAVKILEKMRRQKPPVFLPYLNGERAPVWNPKARGAFFGLSADCGPEDLAYAALEGVCFSLLHVYETLGRPDGTLLKLSGGAAGNPLLNLIKAELFGLEVSIPEEREATALGAAMTAMIGDGYYGNWQDSAVESMEKERILPTGQWKEWLRNRYGIYRELYPALKTSMEEWNRLS